MPISLLALALSAFAIGTTEFVIMGLLPNVALDLHVSIPLAGWLISGYALGVAIGAPIMAVLTAKLPRKITLLLLMVIFIVGNVMCAFSYSYGFLMLARVITALCHGAFFGIGAVVAANLVAPNRRASAVALMFTGLTLANVLGVPLGTALGQALGWRSTFWAVSLIGIVSLFALYKNLPDKKEEDATDLRKEIAALASVGLWLSLSITMLFSAAMFAMFTYIAPMLTDITGITPHGVSWTLLLIGVGLTVGNVLGGRLADWRLGTSLTLIFVFITVFSSLFSWTSVHVISAEITLFIWAMVAFAAVPALQINVVIYGKNAPNLVSTLNIAAFNVGNALGAWVGGVVIASGMGLATVPLAAGALAFLGFILCAITFRRAARKKA
ncbi:MFS transporter [Rouxiella sp. Mn2063]|uniref:MFS transporter n=1 Tax=Rouxiella sp. Mn2063 TaxID=3395262 RepID=UPI003BBA1923